MGSERKPGWKTWLVLGCSGLLVLLGIAILLFVALWPMTVTRSLDHLTSTVPGPSAVQDAVREHAQAREVQVHIDTERDEVGTSLRIEVTDPGFLGEAGANAPDVDAKALEIAVVARDALPAGTAHERYRVEFVTRTRVGWTMNQFTHTHFFESSELPPSRAATPR